MGSKGGQFRTIRSLDFGYGHKSGMGANSYGSAVPSDGEAHIGTLLEDKSAEGETKKRPSSPMQRCIWKGKTERRSIILVFSLGFTQKVSLDAPKKLARIWSIQTYSSYFYAETDFFLANDSG